MVKVSIIIVGYNSGKFLKGCLDSVYEQSFKDKEIFFVDNASKDNSLDYIKSNYPDVKIIANTVNEGFCKANNQAIRLSMAKYVLTLNADVILEKGFIAIMMNFLENQNNKKIGMLSGKMLRPDKVTVDSTGLVLTRFRRFYDRGSGKRDIGQYDRIEQIFGPCAAAGFYRREMLEDIKENDEYFDERFFCFVEDVDLAWRANKKGWNAFYIPKAICYHRRNSSGCNKAFLQSQSFKNRVFMLLKNEKCNLYNILSFLLYDCPRFVYILFTNRYVFKMACEMIIVLPKIFNKSRVLYHDSHKKTAYT